MKNEKEKIIEIKREVFNIMSKKNNEFTSNNIIIDILGNDTFNFFAIFEKNNALAQIIIGEPDFSPYEFICFEILEMKRGEIIYYWYDDEKTTIQEIVENIEKSIDYFISY